MTDSIKAPWTEEQVNNLNAMQSFEFFHGYTCGSDDCRRHLVATDAGWICPATDCDYVQDWARNPLDSEQLNSIRIQYDRGPEPETEPADISDMVDKLREDRASKRNYQEGVIK